MSTHCHIRLQHDRGVAVVTELEFGGAATAADMLQVRATNIRSAAATEGGTPSHINDCVWLRAVVSQACLPRTPGVATTDTALTAKVFRVIFFTLDKPSVALELGTVRHTPGFPFFVACKLGAAKLTLEDLVKSTAAVHAETRVRVAWHPSETLEHGHATPSSRKETSPASGVLTASSDVATTVQGIAWLSEAIEHSTLARTKCATGHRCCLQIAKVQRQIAQF